MSGATRFLSLCAAGILLAGCASSSPGALTIAGVDLFGAGRAASASGTGNQAIVATRLADGASGTFRRVSARTGVETWAAADGSAFSFRSGVLVASNALGHDLYSADVSDVVGVLGAGGDGSATRVHRYLDGETELETRAFECELDAGPVRDVPAIDGQVRQVTERCNGVGTSFTNDYLISARSGEIVLSTQWVGERVGYVRFVKQTRRRDETAPQPILVPDAIIAPPREDS